MKRMALCLAAMAALAAAWIGPAAAQTSSTDTRFDRLTIKGGLFKPAGDDAQQADKYWLTYGLEYMFGDPEGDSAITLEALYTKADKDFTRDGQLEETSLSYTAITAMVNMRFRRPTLNPTDNVEFYGFGIGAMFTDINADDPGTGLEVDQDNTVGMASVFIGYEFASNLQVELKYNIALGKPAEQDLGGFMLLAGLKF